MFGGGGGGVAGNFLGFFRSRCFVLLRWTMICLDASPALGSQTNVFWFGDSAACHADNDFGAIVTETLQVHS